MHKLFLLLYSLSQLKRSQLFYFIYYRCFGFRRVQEVNIPSEFISEITCTLVSHDVDIIDENANIIRLLNVSVGFAPGNIDWTPQECSRLWRYHLHYFDFLAQKTLSDGMKTEFIEDWIKRNPQGTQPAWEPYTASLRIVNWIGYFSHRQVPAHWNCSLFCQSRWLRANLERHILANHYFENIKALVFAAVYFKALDGALQVEVSGWREFALDELESQLQEQFLPDGGHYERSPMYHNIMMKNCIDLLSILKLNGCGKYAVCDLLQQVIHKGLALALGVERPDGHIPLFNDSTFHHAPSTTNLVKAATAHDIFVVPPEYGPTLISATDTGIYGVKVNGDWLMADCGDVGPGYQPGHTHCDFLSYELMLDNLPVIVNSGVFEYDVTPRRRYLRGTMAHNTVCIDGLEQSEIWSSFRVARRAKKLSAKIQRNCNTITFEGAYKGFFSGLSWTCHTRKLEIALTAEGGDISVVRVWDFLMHKKHKALNCTGFVHFHPAISVECLSDHEYLLKHSHIPIARLYIETATDVKLVPSFFSPEFGLGFDSKKLAIKAYDNRIAYEIHRIASS